MARICKFKGKVVKKITLDDNNWNENIICNPINYGDWITGYLISDNYIIYKGITYQVNNLCQMLCMRSGGDIYENDIGDIILFSDETLTKQIDYIRGIFVWQDFGFKFNILKHGEGYSEFGSNVCVKLNSKYITMTQALKHITIIGNKYDDYKLLSFDKEK